MKILQTFDFWKILASSLGYAFFTKKLVKAYFQFYDNLVETGTPFLYLNHPRQAGIMYHSKSNLLGFKLHAYKSYVYTGFKLRYLAVGKRKILLTNEDFQSLNNEQFVLNQSDTSFTNLNFFTPAVFFQHNRYTCRWLWLKFDCD